MGGTKERMEEKKRKGMGLCGGGAQPGEEEEKLEGSTNDYARGGAQEVPRLAQVARAGSAKGLDWERKCKGCARQANQAGACKTRRR